MKLSAHDIANLLVQFHISSEKPPIHSIDQLRITHPTQHTTQAAFRFKRQLFYIIIDITAEDNTEYLLRYIHAEKPEAEGEFITLPEQSSTTYALPFKGKDAYLFRIRSPKQRLDIYLSERYSDISRSTWQKYIKAGYIKVDGEIITSPKQEISIAAAVAVTTPKMQDYSNQTLPILFLDDNIIVIDKPAGILTHAKGALNEEFTVADFFRRYTSFGLDTNRPGIIHRLDRDTSGVLIGVRNPETASLLQKQFADRRVKKIYLAITDGILKEKEAHIELPIGRHPAAPSTFRVDAKGKPASTRYHVLAEKNGKSLVKLMPLTGRTHQLRVHLQYLHAPIHGDSVYGKPAERLYLHAYQLEITTPGGERKIFTAPIPEAFKELFPDDL